MKVSMIRHNAVADDDAADDDDNDDALLLLMMIMLLLHNCIHICIAPLCWLDD